MADFCTPDGTNGYRPENHTPSPDFHSRHPENERSQTVRYIESGQTPFQQQENGLLQLNKQIDKASHGKPDHLSGS